uniref:Uncharacterized protein n=1 Tax=Cacopsylla melanoneura TaxID=428564 RepID=A0A8D8QRV5_9HEMI
MLPDHFAQKSIIIWCRNFFFGNVAFAGFQVKPSLSYVFATFGEILLKGSLRSLCTPPETSLDSNPLKYLDSYPLLHFTPNATLRFLYGLACGTETTHPTVR